MAGGATKAASGASAARTLIGPKAENAKEARAIMGARATAGRASIAGMRGATEGRPTKGMDTEGNAATSKAGSIIPTKAGISLIMKNGARATRGAAPSLTMRRGSMKAAMASPTMKDQANPATANTKAAMSTGEEGRTIEFFRSYRIRFSFARTHNVNKNSHTSVMHG